MRENSCHRLAGLEPDNPLAFLAALGLLQSLSIFERDRPASEKLNPKLSWDISKPPLRPKIHVTTAMSQQQIAESAASGLEKLERILQAEAFNRDDLNFTRTEAHGLLAHACNTATSSTREGADLFASLMTDAAIKETKDFSTSPVDPTPFCLLFGQGHQHFLERFTGILHENNLPERGERKARHKISLAECIKEALFEPWHREDPSTFAFRWDPEEDVRYALMAGNPTDNAYKGGTQHGANCLAIAGMATLTVVPQNRAGRVRPTVIGGAYSREGFSFAWPIWRGPLSLPTIRSLLAHPEIRKPNALAYLGVDHVRITRRISVGKFMNFTHARVLEL
jgi:hypothetical protein